MLNKVILSRNGSKVTASLVSLYLFFKLVRELFENELNTIDVSMMSAVYAHRTPALTNFMIFISGLGGYFLIILTIIITSGLLIKRFSSEAVFFLVVILGSELLNLVAKSLIARPRPSLAPLVHETSFSFPSGHSMGSFVVYMLIVYGIYYFTKNKTISRVALFIAVLLIVAIGFSRIYLGVHYPTDVLGGYLAGSCWLLLALSMRHQFIRQR